MSIKPLLFAGIKANPSPKQELTLVDHLQQVMNRSRGVQTIFDLAVNAFSWARLAPVGEPLQGYFSQARCMAFLCKSAYEFLRAPWLLTQAMGLLNRGKRVKRGAVLLKDHVRSNEWNAVEVRKVFTVAKEVMGWLAGTVSWACRTLAVANESLVCMISTSVMSTVNKVGSVSGIISFGITMMNQAQELVARAALPKTHNLVLLKARRCARNSLACSTVSSGARVLSMIGSGLRTFSLVIVPVTFSLALSTVALTFTIRSIYLENRIRLEAARIRIPV